MAENPSCFLYTRERRIYIENAMVKCSCFCRQLHKTLIKAHHLVCITSIVLES